VKYADYFRRAKVQETVFELLTEQYELAKVEEAKETPSVKVLDVAEVPEKKSYPHRMPIIAEGTVAAIVFCVVWIFVSKSWQETDPQDQRKAFVQKVLATWNVLPSRARRNQTDESHADGG
jgi:uncharacterized protein involved in exopolysaccharide biosynthesis